MDAGQVGGYVLWGLLMLVAVAATLWGIRRLIRKKEEPAVEVVASWWELEVWASLADGKGDDRTVLRFDWAV